MGIDVNAQSQPVGSTLPIWVAGPAARGRFGELMGLPQVADHAQQVAHAVLENWAAANAFYRKHTNLIFGVGPLPVVMGERYVITT